MPELPEAETIVRGLRTTVVGETIVRARVVRPDILREPPRAFTPRVRNRTIVAVERRAKNVLLRLDTGGVVAVNLGMTGRLLPLPAAARSAAPPGERRPGHPAVWFFFESGGRLVFDDTRRFGTVECLSAVDWDERSSRFGPEPLEASYRPADLHASMQRSRSPIRSWLLDQRRIAGVGNIYAAEALFLAGIHPLQSANSLGSRDATALHRAVRKVLSEAIAAGGTTIRDYRNSEGAEGLYAPQLSVYGRDGEPCHSCGTMVERIVFAGRSAFFCPACQALKGSP
jgi:formamidopyrimidine-DNA glycosylase